MIKEDDTKNKLDKKAMSLDTIIMETVYSVLHKLLNDDVQYSLKQLIISIDSSNNKEFKNFIEEHNIDDKISLEVEICLYTMSPPIINLYYDGEIIDLKYEDTKMEKLPIIEILENVSKLKISKLTVLINGDIIATPSSKIKKIKVKV